MPLDYIYRISATINDEPVTVEIASQDADSAQEQFFNLYEYNSDDQPNCISGITVRSI